MPHQCTGCGHTFEDGSKEMLSGCPECGGNKFQFRPSEEALSDPTDGDHSPPDEEPPEPPEPPATDSTTSSVAETVGRATTRVRDLVSSSEQPAPDETAGTTNTASDAEAPTGDDLETPSSSSASTEPAAGAAGSDTDSNSGSGPDPEAEWPGNWSGSDSDASEAGESPPSGASDPSASSGDDARDSEILDDSAGENSAQATARSDVVSPDELNAVARSDPSPTDTDTTTSPTEEDTTTSPTEEPAPRDDASASSGTPPETDADTPSASPPDDDQPDLAELREQLNEQFESIKIVEPGQYELNLMELYDREEYIIALQENGRYVIQVPEQWMGDDPGER